MTTGLTRTTGRGSQRTMKDKLFRILVYLNVFGVLGIAVLIANAGPTDGQPVVPAQPQEVVSVPKPDRQWVGLGSYDKRAKKLRNDFLKDVAKELPDLDHIVLITLNKQTRSTASFAHTVPESTEGLCYQKICVPAQPFPGLTSLAGENEQYLFESDTLGSWFAGIQTHRKKAPTIYPIVLEYENLDYPQTDQLVNYILKHLPKEETLILGSFRMSRHVSASFSQFHDYVSLQSINYNDFHGKRLNLESPNGIMLLTKLARALGTKQLVPIHYGTNQSATKGKSGSFATHLFAMFANSDSHAQWTAHGKKDVMGFLDDYKFWSGVKSPPKVKEVIAQGNVPHVAGIRFGDAHYTRGIKFRHDKSEKGNYPELISQFLSEEGSIYQSGLQFHHKPLYGFDVAGFNLETAVAKANECRKRPGKGIIFRTEPERLEVFRNMGFTATTLANNHSHDCTEKGLAATQKYLKAYGFKYFGVTKYSNQVRTTEHNGLKVARFGFNDVDLENDRDAHLASMRSHKAKGYRIIVNMHRGIEYNSKNSKTQQKRAYKLIDEGGADLIIGHHPHVVQNIERYKGVPIVYSLGNFVFDQPFAETLKGMALAFVVSNYGVKIEPIYFIRDKKLYNARWIE